MPVSTRLAALPPRWRWRLLALASVAYVGALAVWVDGGREPSGWLGGCAGFAIALFAARRGRRSARAIAWGFAVVVASLGAHGHSRGLDACSSIGEMACAIGACVAVVRIPPAGGLVRAPVSSPVAGVVVIAAAWWLAIVASIPPRRLGLAATDEPPLAWAVVAAVSSMAVLFGAALWTSKRRRLELDVAERGRAMGALLVTSLAASCLIGVLGRIPAETVSRSGVAVASALVGGVALAEDAVRVAHLTRRLVVLAIVGGGVALLGASAASGRGWDAWGVTLATALVALAIGAAAPGLEAPLRPARGAWIDAFERAGSQTSRGDPDEAIREALLALRAPRGPAASSPELWTLAPGCSMTVDAAGYLHEREAELPEGIVRLALGEPEAALRAEVLDALEVKLPELRTLSRWMTDRGAAIATVIASEGEIEGVLVLARGSRDEPFTLEEVRGLRGLADRMAAPCRARAMRSRMLARAREEAQRAESSGDTVERLRHERALDVGRDALATARLARPATVGIYSAASRMALESLERRTALGAPIFIIAPSGVDPVPYLARAHLAGRRREAPLVLVDATSVREHDLARWTQPSTSPLALAHGGMLVLLDGAALPGELQQLVARTLAEKRAPWERPDALDVQLALTAVASPAELEAHGQLDPSLAARLADAHGSPVVLPRLRERGDDLRAILTDRLAREGLRRYGRPVGIEQAAYARLVDYPFPGEDAEFASIVRRLVARCVGDVVRAADVEDLHLPREAKGRKDPLTA